MVIQKREEVRLPAGHPRPVQRVTDPPFIAVGSLEPAEHRRPGAAGHHQVQPVEVPQQRRFRRRPAGRGPQDPGDLGDRTVRVLPLERFGQLEHLGVDPGARLPGRRRQGLEATGPVPADPPIQRFPGVPHPAAERAVMGAPGDLPDHRPALLGRQARLKCRADQLVPEQRDLLRPFPPFECVHLAAHQTCFVASDTRQGLSGN